MTTTFKLTQSPAFSWPVRFTLPSEADPGQRTPHGFIVRFRRLHTDAHRALVKRALEERWQVDRFVGELVLDVQGVEDERGLALPYSTELLADLCGVPGVAEAIAAAYVEATSPTDETKRQPAAAGSAA